MPGYSKIPDYVRDLIGRCTTNTFYVSKVRTYSLSALASGVLAHLQITADGESVSHETGVVPAATNGRWSRYNLEGKVVVRKDLPKVEKEFGGWTVPNFGDWGRGSHVHYATRKVFQREIWHGKQYPILIDVQGTADGRATLGFRVDCLFDRTALEERDLHLAVSLLRENLHSGPTITSSELSTADWLDDQQVSWEFLPKGELSFDRVVTRFRRKPTGPSLTTVHERFDAVSSLHPNAIVIGEGKFARYIGFKFREDLVVLENFDYGNALYVMYDDWATLSRRSRMDLLSDPQADFDRIRHTDGWEDRLRALLTFKGHDLTGRDGGDAPSFHG